MQHRTVCRWAMWQCKSPSADLQHASLCSTEYEGIGIVSQSAVRQHVSCTEGVQRSCAAAVDACDDACAGCAGHMEAYHLKETVVQGCHQGLLMASIVIRHTHVRPDSQSMERCDHARPVSHVTGSAEYTETNQDKQTCQQAVKGRQETQAGNYDTTTAKRCCLSQFIMAAGIKRLARQKRTHRQSAHRCHSQQRFAGGAVAEVAHQELTTYTADCSVTHSSFPSTR